MEEFILKVDESVLKQQAENVSMHIELAETAFLDLENSVGKTCFYWIGEAGDHHRRLFRQMKPQVDEALKKLKEYPEKLLKMAGICEGTEKRSTSGSHPLRGNVIS